MPTCEKIKKLNISAGGNIAPTAFIPSGAKVEYPINLMHNVTVYGSTIIGYYTYINVNTVIYPKVKIGRFCSIARNCEIGVAFHPIDRLSTSPISFDKSIFKDSAYQSFPKEPWGGHKDVVIGSDVWIGAKVVINGGVTIGDGAIIGSSSVVTKDIPPYAIVGGVPAKVIGYRFSKAIIKQLLKLEWWNLPLKTLQTIDFTDVKLAIKQLEEL